MTEKTTQTAGQKCAADIAALLRARNPLIWCVTREEARTERIIIEACAAANYPLVAWDCSRGLTRPESGLTANSECTDPAQALQFVRDSNERRAWILRDLHAWLKDATVCRAVRSCCRMLPALPRDKARAMIVTAPTGEIPPELAGHAIVIDIPLPDRAEIAQLLDAAINALPDDLRKNAAPNGQRDAAIDAAIGLTSDEAQSTFARSLILNRTMDPATISKEKRRVISRERVLEWFDPLPAGLDGIGGLELLKGWLIDRREAFTPAAREYGLPAPRGALFVGPPGCGKSLTVKAIATAWGMPLLRLDLGALRSKWVGDSEANIRKALKVAETVAPCILWADEIEKGLAGATQGAADGGTSADALGTILTFMQERTAPVFFAATANRAELLPPEFLRRFDETFFVDLPTASERVAIVGAALREFGRDVASIDAVAVASATVDFSGAEIAKLVPAAMYRAFAEARRPISTSDLVSCAGATVPVAKTASERITALRQWAQSRARPASRPETATSGAVALDME